MKKYLMTIRNFGLLLAAGCLLLAGCEEDAEARKHPAPSQLTAKAEKDDSTARESPFRLVADQSEDAPSGNWGTLRGRFLFGGEAPKPEAIVVTKDADYCGQHNVVDQSLVVSQDSEVANVFVYIYVPRGQKLEVHESYSETAEDEVVLDNSKCMFEPHCLAMRTSQTLVVKNSDPVGHNTNVFHRTEQFNETVASGGSPLEKTFNLGQTYPVPVKCNIHPWMTAHLLIRDDPYMAISGGDGTFEIKNIPAGEHEFVFWHERPGTLRDVSMGDGKTDRRGRVKIEIPAGQVVDLGEIKVPADSLKEQY